ncbi:hypothetical protein Ddye_020462 [Dipteronia dyeriana]|uniref:Uncharacterized protein n=1 Tax=Dipteronia dyeriana TaxID=168575 RepID=A0AAD9U0A4_9ROSI|nr:hypothetical protein Ddye_020462 [Dipteronia dyeriana]
MVKKDSKGKKDEVDTREYTINIHKRLQYFMDGRQVQWLLIMVIIMEGPVVSNLQQTYEFIRKWLIEHPLFLNNQLFIGGDSDSSILVPRLFNMFLMATKLHCIPVMYLICTFVMFFNVS